MDLTSTLKGEVVRPFVTLVIPGATAIAPFLVKARLTVPALATYLETHRTIALLGLIVTVLAMGLILESLGALWESKVIDARLAKRYPDLYTEWYEYLRLSFDKEPVGQRYLRTVTLHLRFEVAMAPALFFAAGGANWLNTDLGILSATRMGVATVIILLLSGYFAWQSSNSAEVLAKVRYALLTPRGTDVGKRFLKSSGTPAAQ